MSKWKKIEELVSSLRKERERANDLHDQLERSLALQKMCPSAFDCGKCTAIWKYDDNRNVIFEIMRGDGSTITIPFDEVSDFFELEEAVRRGITGGRRDNPSAIKTNDPVGQAILKFMRIRRRGNKDG